MGVEDYFFIIGKKIRYSLGGGSPIVIITISGEEDKPKLSVTTREKVNTAGLFGAVKLGFATVELLRITDGPLV